MFAGLVYCIFCWKPWTGSGEFYTTNDDHYSSNSNNNIPAPAEISLN